MDRVRYITLSLYRQYLAYENTTSVNFTFYHRTANSTLKVSVCIKLCDEGFFDKYDVVRLFSTASVCALGSPGHECQHYNQVPNKKQSRCTSWFTPRISIKSNLDRLSSYSTVSICPPNDRLHRRDIQIWQRKRAKNQEEEIEAYIRNSILRATSPSKVILKSSGIVLSIDGRIPRLLKSSPLREPDARSGWS